MIVSCEYIVFWYNLGALDIVVKTIGCKEMFRDKERVSKFEVLPNPKVMNNSLHIILLYIVNYMQKKKKMMTKNNNNNSKKEQQLQQHQYIKGGWGGDTSCGASLLVFLAVVLIASLKISPEQYLHIKYIWLSYIGK